MELSCVEGHRVLGVAAREESAAGAGAPDAQVPLRRSAYCLALRPHNTLQCCVRQGALTGRAPGGQERGPEARVAPHIEEELSLVAAQTPRLPAMRGPIHRGVASILHIPTHHTLADLARIHVSIIGLRAREAKCQVEVPGCGMEEPLVPQQYKVREGVAVYILGKLLEDEITREASEVEDFRKVARALSGPAVDLVNGPLKVCCLRRRDVAYLRVDQVEICCCHATLHPGITRLGPVRHE
mmetsp:Transcript_104833/g.224046  ORF Transcript_104833/g.224046 Transcript_104833/m.224046 type:complete len:241 (+) Transcript_104833:130-852(+)